MRRAYRGQSIVEFAIVLPFLMLLLMGIIFFSMVFVDYLWLSDVARSAAREASLVSAETYARRGYSDVIQKCAQREIVFGMFDWQPSSSGANSQALSIDYVGSADSNDNGMVDVKINAKLDRTGSFFARVLGNLADAGGFEGIQADIDYKMYSENKQNVSANTGD